LKIPKRLQPLVHEGLIDEVIRQLMSGKEATVYVVRCGDDVRCAKVYKEPEKRGFRQAALYQEGRKTKNSRQARAMAKGTRFGRKAQEEAWQNVEVDALYRLAAVGVRVPRPHAFSHGVVLMELLVDSEGNAAPRLNDVTLSEALALEYHGTMLREIVRMLCAGIIHGDLSEYNVLVTGDGPVIIDLPQAVDAAANNNAAVMLKRDVRNITSYFSRVAPTLASTQYGDEIWSLYERASLHPEIALTGHFAASTRPPDVAGDQRRARRARGAAATKGARRGLGRARRRAIQDARPPGRDHRRFRVFTLAWRFRAGMMNKPKLRPLRAAEVSALPRAPIRGTR
jgi:RIO kinase 1